MKDMLPPEYSSENEPTNQHNLMKEENEKLIRENAALKISLQKEELYHKNLYQQWKELNAQVNETVGKLEQLKNTQNPKKVYRLRFYGLVIITAILLIINLYLFIKTDDKTSEVIQHSLIKEPKDTVQAIRASHKSSTETNPSSLIKANSDSLIKNKPARYLVKAKSFFHNKPDTTTRRSTFLLPWSDEYGIVTGTDERNGFIYVVFKNRAGITSKGWILKSDLEPVKQ